MVPSCGTCEFSGNDGPPPEVTCSYSCRESRGSELTRRNVETFGNDDFDFRVRAATDGLIGLLVGVPYVSMGLGTCCYASLPKIAQHCWENRETWTIIYEYLHSSHSNSLPQYAILLLCMLSSCAEFQGGTFVLRLHQIASQLYRCKGPRVLANSNFCTKIEAGLRRLRFYSIHN